MLSDGVDGCGSLQVFEHSIREFERVFQPWAEQARPASVNRNDAITPLLKQSPMEPSRAPVPSRTLAGEHAQEVNCSGSRDGSNTSVLEEQYVFVEGLGGVFQSRILQGLLLIAVASASISSAIYRERCPRRSTGAGVRSSSRLCRAARALWVSEVAGDSGLNLKRDVLGQLFASVPGQGLTQLFWERGHRGCQHVFHG